MDKEFITVKELAQILPIGLTNVYSLVHSKDFPSITIGRRIVIPVKEFNLWCESSLGKKINI